MILSNSCILNERYTIQSVLGEVGPFDVNYLAWDLKEEKEVVVREYYPVSLAKRAADGMLLEVHDAELFEYGLGAYSAEGVLLTKIKHDAIAGCQEQFKQNGTVYCVNNFISGAPIGAYLKQQPGGKLTEEDALPIMDKVMQALQVCHDRKLFHGGVSPKSILITSSGEPMLLGFQGARFKLARESNTLDEVIRPGYSAPEQVNYETEEGPWWDIYGCASTLFHMLTGQDLPPAKDAWSSSKIRVALYRDALLYADMSDTLAVALSYEESERPASIDAFREMLVLTQKKVTHQLHEGDGSPQYDVEYEPALPAPQEGVWQNGKDIKTAKVKIETEVIPEPVAQVEEKQLVEEKEFVEREMPNVVPTNPPQLVPSTNGQNIQPQEVPAPRGTGREQELEVLLTKMVKGQQVFVAAIIGIVVVALLGLIGGVYFGPALFQQQPMVQAPPAVEIEPPVSGSGLPAAALAAAVPEGEEEEQAEDIAVDEPDAPTTERTNSELAEAPGTEELPEPTLTREQDESRSEERASNSASTSNSSSSVAEENTPPVTQPTTPAREPEPEAPSQVADAEEPASENQESESAGIFFTDEELGVSTEAPTEEAGSSVVSQEQASLFNYYRVQGDSLLNQGFNTAALQWYQNALKYNPDDTYINEQIVMITDSIAREERAVREQDSLQLRLEQVRDQQGIFLLPDTPVAIVNEAGLRQRIKYPIAAINGNVSGRVILRYVVDEQGRIQDINVVKGLGWGTEEVLIDLLQKATFTPATFNGENVKAWGTFTAVFRLEN